MRKRKMTFDSSLTKINKLLKSIKDPTGIKHHRFIINETARFVGKRLPRDIHILDVGCGVGELAGLLANLGYRVLGIDIHKPSIEEARKRNPFNNISFQCQDAANLNLEDKFDVVVASEVLEHLKEPEKLIAKVNALLKANGLLIITLPNGYGPRELINRIYQRYLLNSFIHRLLRGIRQRLIKDQEWASHPEKSITLGSNEFPHIQFFNFERLKDILQSKNFRIIKRRNGSFISNIYVFKILFDNFLILKRIDVLIADILPHFLASSWFIVAKKI
jgi:2-polyprenyl-3-methyl-5-hydroxy-6-metoxy-1,4-benzoquinol methylase